MNRDLTQQDIDLGEKINRSNLVFAFFRELHGVENRSWALDPVKDAPRRTNDDILEEAMVLAKKAWNAASSSDWTQRTPQ